MRSILKQGSILILAQILTRIVSFFYTIYLARNLGVSNFGLYTVALSYFFIISSIADFGFSRFLIRESSKDFKKIPELVFNIALLRLTLASILFAFTSVLFYLFDPDKSRVGFISLAVIAVLPQAVASVLDGVFVALQKLRYSAISLVLSVLTTAALGFLLIQLSFGVAGALVALLIGQVVLVFILWVFLFRIKVISLSKITLGSVKSILKGSLPYGLLGILGILYFRIDALLLSYIRGSFETGLYGAAYRFLDAVVFIPVALSTALYPVLAKLHDKDPDSVKKLYIKSLKVMVLFGSIILLGYIVILPVAIKILLPSYTSAINAVLILSMSIPFMFAHAPGVQVLFSTDKYLKHVTILSCLTLLFNVVLNLLFIPQFGLYAAAWVTVASEILSFIIFFLLIRIKIFR